MLTGRRSGVPLTAKGRAQAAAVADRLAREEVRLVQSSPRERAVETARIIADRLGVPMEITDALDEIDFGGWAGQSFEALDSDPDWATWNDHRGEAGAPGGETMAAAVERAAGHILSIPAGNGGVVCVSHSDIIRGTIARILGLPLGNVLRFDIDPASLSVVVAGDWGARLLSLNERAAA